MSAKGEKGKEEEAAWVMIGMDPKVARKQGMPQQIPVPRAEFEGLADKGLNVELARKWTKEFLSSDVGSNATWRRRNSSVAQPLEVFVDKGAFWDKAQKAFGEKDFEKAIASLKRIAAMDPEDHMAKYNLGCALANQGDFAGSLKQLKAIKDTFSGDPDYHVTLGHVHNSLKDTDGAIGEMVLALEAKGDHQPALSALERMGVLVSIYENPRDAQSLLYVRKDSVLDYLTSVWDAEARAEGYFLEQLAYHEREGRWEVAIGAAERAIKAAGDAGSERGETAKIGALRALGKKDDALAAAQAYVAKKPNNAAALVELGRSLAELGQIDEARATVDRALEIDPGDQIALVARFWPAKTDDVAQVAMCLPAITAFAEAHPTSAGAWRSVARANLVVGRAEQGIDLFQKALDLAPNDDDLRSELWSELRKQGRFQEIIDAAEKLGDLKSKDWKLRWSEAEAYLGLGKRQEARVCFTAINADDTLHVDIRKRAKRAVNQMDMPSGLQTESGAVMDAASLVSKVEAEHAAATDKKP